MGKINFFGEINNDTLNSLMHGIESHIDKDKPDSIYIRFSSAGGDINAGISMYSFLRSLRIPIVMHNFGNTDSVAIIPYLAAEKRLAVPDARFVIHRISTAIQGGYQIASISEIVDSLEFDVERYCNIFNQRTNNAKSPIDIRNALEGRASFTLSASEAVECGIATGIAYTDTTL